jgi:hypothetical protein
MHPGGYAAGDVGVGAFDDEADVDGLLSPSPDFGGLV